MCLQKTARAQVPSLPPVRGEKDPKEPPTHTLVVHRKIGHLPSDLWVMCSLFCPTMLQGLSRTPSTSGAGDEVKEIRDLLMRT